MKHLLISIIFLLLSTLTFGSDNNSDNLTVSHTFNSGETISSSKMNENFQSIVEGLNQRILSLENKLNNLVNEDSFSQKENIIEVGNTRIISGFVDNYDKNTYSPDNPLRINFEEPFQNTPLIYLTGRGDSHNYVGGSDQDLWKGFCGLEYCSVSRAGGNGEELNYLIIGEK